jgi:DNA-binding MarR family transcriptional regulator
MRSPDDDEQVLDPALDFLRALWRVDHALNRKSKWMSAELGVTAEQRLILRCVGRVPGIAAGRLAALLFLDAGTVSVTIARLAQRRLLERKRDPDDHRRVTLRLTPGGQALVRTTAGTVEAAVVKVLDATTANDLGATRRVLARLGDALDAALRHAPGDR